jgi:glyoxylase-like metal-dependent hydrolase (beta-lactamase superfamily II)
MSRTNLKAFVLLAAGFSIAGISSVDAAVARRMQTKPPLVTAPAVVRTVRLRDNIFVLLGAGGNITAQVGDKGVVLVNAGTSGTSEAVLAALAKVTDQPIRMILNTGAEARNTGGNEALYRAGRYLGDRAILNHAQISAHEAVLKRLSSSTAAKPAAPESAWPTDVYFTDSLEFYFNGESFVMLSMPASVADGTSIVYFRKSDVISAGELFLQNTYPVIDIEHGGTINGTIDALNRIIDIAIPDEYQEGGTMIVSGDGRPSDEYELITYRDMVTIFRDRIADLKKKGMTLAQVLAAKPTSDYDGRYGVSPEWTPAQFVEAVFRSLPPVEQK